MTDERTIQELQRQSQVRYRELERGYQQAIYDLERAHREKMNHYLAQIREMTQAQRAQQEKRIRAEMEGLRQETNRRLREQEEERKRKLEELQRYYQTKLDRLMRRVEQDEQAEQRYALAQRQAAEEALKRLREDPVVQRFLPQAAAQAQERINSAAPLLRQRLYTVAAARWFTVAVTCASDQMEAETIRERWERRRNTAEARLLGINSAIQEKLDSPVTFAHVISQTEQIPAEWVKGLPQATHLRETVAQAWETFRNAVPGETEAFDWAEVLTFGLEEEIESVRRAAQREITRFLCCAEIEQIFFYAVGEDWSLTEGGGIECFKNIGNMVLSAGPYDHLQVEIFPQRDDWKSFVLIVLYKGHQAKSTRLRQLYSIIGNFDKWIRDPACCGMQIVATSDFMEQDAPGIRLELRLIPKKEDEA